MSSVPQSAVYDLGLDTTRMRDTKDVLRQRGTVEKILERFFHADPAHRWELQILADEVGLGKTYVALGVAYSVLEHMRGSGGLERPTNGGVHPALSGCYRKIVVVTPNNRALFKKWSREVGEFVRRCVPQRSRTHAEWFRPAALRQLDELVAAMIDPSPEAPCILVASTGTFSRRLRDYPLKRRRVLAALFRRWNQSFRHDARTRLLKGAPDDWPRDSRELGCFDDHERARLLFSDQDFEDAMDRYLATGAGERRAAALLDECRIVAEPYRRGRDEAFAKISGWLNEVYKGVVGCLARGALPLIIVDEAHNWKNGPSQKTNGYQPFVDALASRSRRMLLLTATPFQLHPAEMLQLLRIGETQELSANAEEAQQRREVLRLHRERVVAPALESARRSSRRLARQWGRLPRRITTEVLEALWNSEHLQALRTELRTIAERPGALTPDEIGTQIDEATATMDPDVRAFFREALQLYAYNQDLSVEMGYLVIRHRRRTTHRRFLVGEEFGVGTANGRPDAHVLHTSAGLDVRGAAELPHYLLMRSVAQMHWDRGNERARTSLGTALTGCYSTLLHSADGQAIRKRLAQSPAGRFYLDALLRMVSEDSDRTHPKVDAVVRQIVEAWDAGEKSLIFCFRANTARRLADIIRAEIDSRMEARQQRCLGGEEALRRFRSRLTNRTQDLVTLGLDRVLWSAWWARKAWEGAAELSPTEFVLTSADLRELAALSLRYDVPLNVDRVDRVFLTRSVEHVLAARWLRDLRPQGWWRELLEQIADRSWVEAPYGGEHDTDPADDASPDPAATDERGVHTVYDEADASPIPETIDALADELEARRVRAGGRSLFQAYATAPSLWLGDNPTESAQPDFRDASAARLERLHGYLWRLTEGFDFLTRRLVLQGLRRAVLRDSVLLRLLPQDSGKGETRWGEILVASFYAQLSGQRECMADRITIYLEDLASASGNILDPKDQRHALYDATRLREGFVSLVTGATKNRDRVFTGFNTPLAPEVLICTSVGQEGIDLHRHCRHVVHYDLPWNPALLEQRTGRVDRIGSKTFRERAVVHEGPEPRLDIGVPFLAGTYDERVYEELRLRAQTFEVLTGGDVVADDASATDDHATAEGEELGMTFVALPEAMADELRVELRVEAAPEARAERREIQPTEEGEMQQHPMIEFAEKLDHAFQQHATVLDRDNPWFGHFELAGGNRARTYRIGRTHHVEYGIIDWRHPLAQAFYEYRPGEEFELDGAGLAAVEGVVDKRAEVSSIPRRVTRIRCETTSGRHDITVTDDGRFTLDHVPERAEAQTGLPNILALLTPEQYRLITASRDRPVIVQGRAGSGKTTVALYRVSWLTHARDDGPPPVDPSKVLVVMFNRALSQFVRGSLEPLQLQSAQLDTFHAWALREIKRAYKGRVVPDTRNRDGRAEATAIKKKLGVLHAVDAFVERQVVRLRAWMAKRLEPYRAQEWLDRFDGSEEPVVRALVRLRAEARHARDGASGPDKARLEQIHKLLVKGVERMIQYKDELLKLLTDKELLSHHLPDVTADELDALATFQTTVQREQASERRPGPFVTFEDFALILRLIQRKNGGFPDGDAEDGIEIFDHLVVDETQDFGAVELTVLLDSVRTRRGVTIVGDLNQKIVPDADFMGWDRLAAELGLAGAEVAQLEVGHRSTRAIMEVADSVLGEETTGGCDGPKPTLTIVETEGEVLQHVAQRVRELAAADPRAHICVVPYWARSARGLHGKLAAALADVDTDVRHGHNKDFHFGAGVTVTNLRQVKGLEFDAVVVVNPTEQFYPDDDDGRRQLYTLLTRAKDDLHLVCRGEPTPLLADARVRELFAEAGTQDLPLLEFDDDEDEPL